MSESGKAVFLSYASQDAEAAKRIADALRSAGVEVWFDQSELVGGDSWDQKIRRQIKDCALFVPMISAATQARREGYFRLEWRLAVERMQHMDDDLPFLLPVVIDETRDAEAFVPERFRPVQWTRLPGGETPPAFGMRVKKLLGGETIAGVGDPELERSTKRGSPTPNAVRPAGSRRWLWPALIGAAVVAAIVVSQSTRWSGSPPPTESRPPSVPAAAPLSEARQLVAQAWQALESVPEPSRAELEAATELCKRAASLDATDAEVWAAWSQVETWYVAENVDASAARRESARAKATKAMNLAPKSYEARLAQAVYLVRGEGFDTASSFAAEAEQLLRELLRERPDEPRALLALGHLLRNSRRLDEAGPLFDRLALNPAWLATATNAKGWMFSINGRFDEAGPLAAQSVAARPFYGNVCLQVRLATLWQGDLDLAKAALERLPVADLREDAGATLALEVYRYRREPEQMLRVLNTVPRDWLESLAGTYPKSYYVGVAQQMAGNTAAARVAWQSALKLVEQRAATDTSSGYGQFGIGWLHALLGERPAAEQAFALAKQLGLPNEPMSSALLLGDVETAITELEKASSQRWAQSWAELRLNPDFDPLRANPRFQALLAAAEKDPKRCPHAKLLARTEAAEASKPDSKSVAVLAFANLSDDKNNEYFSDGISEELLNVLAKVPGLKVTARTSSFHFKGKDTSIPEIAQQLGVAYVVEGSVRKSGDKVRITAQLIKAADGFHVWSETFTRELKDIFAVQDEIAGLIAKTLELKIGVDQPLRREVNPEAFRLFLSGRAKVRQSGNANRDGGIADFRAAVALDPDLAEAWAEMADAYIQNARFGGVALETGFREARAAAQKALALAPDSAEVLAAVGWVRRTADWDWRGAEQALRRAVQLSPDNADVLTKASVISLNVGHVDEAVQLGRRAVALDPLNPEVHFNLSFILGNAGRLQEAVESARRAVALAPDAEDYHANLSAALADAGQLDEAERELALEPHGDLRISNEALILIRRGRKGAARAKILELEGLPNRNNDMAEFYAENGDIDLAFAALEKSYALHETGMPWVKVDYYLKNLHSDPRWPVFLRKMGLADEQLK